MSRSCFTSIARSKPRSAARHEHGVAGSLVAGALGLVWAVTLVVSATSARASDPVDEFRVKMEKWVQTRQLISKEKADWEAEREMLEDTRKLLQDQRKTLKEQNAELDTTITTADQERVDLLLHRGEYKRSTTAMREWQADLEKRVLALVPMLPEPLQTKLQPLLVQIPDDPETDRVSLGKRLVNVLGVILQSEKFDDTATLTGETRAVKAEGGQKVQVRTLYWGLGQAVYVDSPGKSAGVGRPGPEGWVFTEEPDLADDAKALIDIYEGNVDQIRFVDMPVQIQP